MNKKSKKTLKNAFNIPEPNQKDSFFNKLDIKPERKFSSFIPTYLPTAIVAVMIIGVWGGIKNLPRFEQPENTDNNIIYSSESSVSEKQTDNSVQTTISSVRYSEKQTQTTTAVQTANGSTVGEKDISVTTTSGKTTKNNSDKNKDESSADSPSENTSDNDSDSTSESSRTNIRHTTNTTRHTTNAKTTNTTTMSTREQNNIKPTKPSTTTQTTTTDHNSGFSPLPQTTTTTTFDDTIDFPPCTEPSQPSVDVPHDYTVSPPVRYYPDDNAIDIRDFTQNDHDPPPTDGTQSGEPNSVIWEDLVNDSNIILIATVDEVMYTGIDGVPYTQENLSVSEVIKGDIEQYSRISVYGTGGYIPASEYKKIQIEWAIENNCMLFDPAGNKTVSQVGDRYLYFIKKSDSPLPDGSYRLTTYNDISKFRYTDGYYINMNNSNFMFTLTELYNLINN